MKSIDKQIDYVINCSGFGARKFSMDQNVYPTRGQVMRASHYDNFKMTVKRYMISNIIY